MNGAGDISVAGVLLESGWRTGLGSKHFALRYSYIRLTTFVLWAHGPNGSLSLEMTRTSGPVRRLCLVNYVYEGVFYVKLSR